MPRWGTSAASEAAGMASAAEASNVIIFIFISSPGEIVFSFDIRKLGKLIQPFC